MKYLLTLLLILTMITPALTQKKKRPLVIAHRGASGYAPENTLVAVKKALEMKADVIEIDIHYSKEKEVVVIHDETLARTTNGTGKVYETDLATLQKLDAGSWYGDAFAGEKIPTLAEVLALINGRAILLIEFKEPKGMHYEGIEQKVMDIVNEYDGKSWCILQSFHTNVINNIDEIDKSWEKHKLVIGPIPILPLHHDGHIRWGSIWKYRGSAINPHYKFASARMINKAHRKNLKVFTYTVNEKADMKKLIERGIDGIITNYPDRLWQVLNDN